MASLFIAFVFWVIYWLVILPTALILATPYVLVAAFLSPSPYRAALTNYYRQIFLSFAKFWEEMGHELTP